MKRIPITYALLFITLTVACSAGNTQYRAADTTQSAVARQKQELQDAELQEQLEQIAAAARGKVGIAALALETGETVSVNPHDHFPMQSVYKLPIGMAVMQQVDAGKIKLDQKVFVTKSDFVRAGQHSPIRDKYPSGTELTLSELLRYSISESDGTASDVLMKLA